MDRPLIAVGLILAGCVLAVLAVLMTVRSVLPAQARVRPGVGDEMVTVDGLRLRYHPFGRGEPTAVMLHGFASQLEIWQPLGRAWQCGTAIALDLPGFGGSDRPRISYDLETQSHYLLGFLDSLGLGRVALVGQSMGASLAAWTAAHHPERVSAAVLFAPSALPGSLHYDGLRGVLVRPGPLTTLARLVVDIPGAGILLRNSLARQGLSLVTSYDQRFTAALKSLDQPTLLIWSAGDPRVPFRYAKDYLRLVPHAELWELPADVGHGGFHFEADSTAKRVCSFIEAAQPRSR